jgi:hypothetical protein
VDKILAKLIDDDGNDEADQQLPEGIVFPMQTEDDIERLEAALKERNVRHVLVSYYRHNKPTACGIAIASQQRVTAVHTNCHVQ